MNPVIPQLALSDVTLETIQKMGVWNALWLLVLAFGFIAWRAKKIGVTSIGKNEWGMLEIFGFPLIPIPFGIYPYVKGVFHVKEVSTAPCRVDYMLRQSVNDSVLGIAMSVHITATTKGTGSFRQRFLQLRRDLIAALYGAYDESVTDAENPERISQTRDMLEAATRAILRERQDVTHLTYDNLVEKCGEELRTRLGEYIVTVYVREDAPVDGQLWKDGRRSTDPDSDDAPALGTTPGLRAAM